MKKKIMNEEIFLSTIEKWVTSEWKWDRMGWPKIVKNLGLKIISASESGSSGRINYESSFRLKTWMRWTSNQVISLNIELNSWSELEDLDRTNFNRTMRTIQASFDQIVSKLSEFLGPPNFVGHEQQLGFPEDQSADILALWQLSSTRIIIKEVNGGPETPIALLLVFTAPI